MSLGLRESAFPPDDATFTGAITLRLASGSASLEEVVEEFIELADDFELNFPDDDPVAPADVPAIVAAVAAEFNRCVTVTSPDAEALQLSLDALAGVQIAYLFGQAYDGAEALEMVNELRVEVEQQGVTLRGYLYSDIPALDRMILDRTLTIEVGVFDDGDDVHVVADDAVAILRERGLQASWGGSPGDPILVRPIYFESPLVVEVTDTEASDDELDDLETDTEPDAELFAALADGPGGDAAGGARSPFSPDDADVAPGVRASGVPATAVPTIATSVPPPLQAPSAEGPSIQEQGQQ